MIWSRLGFLVPLIWLSFAALSVFLKVHEYLGQPYDAILVLALCSLVYWFLGRYLNDETRLIFLSSDDPEAVPMRRGKHTLFFIPMEYWAFISGGLAILFLILHELGRLPV